MHIRLFRNLARLAYNIYLSPLLMKPKVVFVLGGPGAGKGTQCQKIVDNFGFIHLSAGDLLRAERARPESKVGQLIEHHITNGTIVPVEVTVSLLDKAMQESGKEKFLVDGFPRNQARKLEDNFDGWQRVMGDRAEVLFVLNLDCSLQTCIDRVMARAKTSHRTDDNIESLRKRMETHKKSTMPIVDHYEKLNMVRNVNADGTVDEIFEDIKKIFEKVQ